jgi:AmiR/NasT family two-component response regulator
VTDVPPGSNFVRSLTQAMGMVSAQAACTLDEAFVLICDRASVRHCSVYEIATAVIDHTIRFDDAYSEN